jgi:hypothetical protein
VIRRVPSPVICESIVAIIFVKSAIYFTQIDTNPVCGVRFERREPPKPNIPSPTFDCTR